MQSVRRPGKAKTLNAIINAALRGQLDETRARPFHDLGPEAVALAMLAAGRHIAEQDTVIATPHGKRQTRQPSLDSVGHGARVHQAQHAEATQETGGHKRSSGPSTQGARAD